MDTVLAEAWTTERFLAWEDRQEGKYEFDGQQVIPMMGGVWIASAHTGGTLSLPGKDVELPMADLYRGLNFPA